MSNIRIFLELNRRLGLNTFSIVTLSDNLSNQVNQQFVCLQDPVGDHLSHDLEEPRALAQGRRRSAVHRFHPSRHGEIFTLHFTVECEIWRTDGDGSFVHTTDHVCIL